MIGRRRRTPRAERTSDVTRFRGVLAAAIVASIAVVATTIARSRGGSPGPLARPHAVAGIACGSCHDAPSMAQACTTCHGPHPSTRGPHRKLAASGALGCADCHPGHNGGGIALFADGRAIRYGAGGELPAGTTAFRPRVTPPAPGASSTAASPAADPAISIPLVAAAACGRCHDVASPRDPIAGCLVAGKDGPTVCFDEHRPIRDAIGAIAPRSAAWDAARDAAFAAPLAPRVATPFSPGPWSWLALGFAAAGLVWGSSRLRKRPPPAPVVPAAAPPRKRLPVIDASTCLGCYACVDACPYDVLEIHRYVAVVARPADCCGLILCEQKCPNGSLAIALGDDPDTAIAVDDALESRAVPGLYVAGDVGGQPLIRNAIDQGARAARAIAAKARVTGLDLVIIGAGPAGLAAALEASALGLRYVALEQATIADSIRSFPRGKLVIDPDLPNTSPLWLAETTKEELLARWTRTVREVKPAIVEGRRVTRIERTADGFVVADVDRDGIAHEHAAAHVIVAIGRRGTPRKLDAEIPTEVAAHVHYSLADARSFAGRRVVVVGLGDVAMEAAIALASQPGTEVTVVARAAEFRRGKARNIAEVRRRVASGALRVVWQAEVAAVAPGRLTLATPTGSIALACDSVFVLIGSIPAEDLLRQIGLQT
jgi:thioredoxin reductase